MPPAHALIAALLAATGAALLILVVAHGFGVARLRLATTGVLVVLMFFLYGVGPVLRHSRRSAQPSTSFICSTALLRAPAGRQAGRTRARR